MARTCNLPDRRILPSWQSRGIGGSRTFFESALNGWAGRTVGALPNSALRALDRGLLALGRGAARFRSFGRKTPAVVFGAAAASQRRPAWLPLGRLHTAQPKESA